MTSAKYFMKFGGREFEDHVVEKFNGLFPNMQGSEDVNMALEHIKFRSIVPVFKENGEVDRRYRRGISNMEAAGCTPASIQSPLSPSKTDELCKKVEKLKIDGPGKRIKKPKLEGPEMLGMKTKYSKTVVKDYHKCQYELFEGFLNISLDKDGFMIVKRPSITANKSGGEKRPNTPTKATAEEFVEKLDSESKSVMEEYAVLEPPTAYLDSDLDNLKKKATLCFEILVKRLLAQLGSMESSNDFMTEKGWKTWREHVMVAASFAVYFLSLQLYRYKKYGSFFDMTE